MTSYITKRIGQALLTIFSVFTVTFVLMRLIPGGPMDFLRAQIMQNRESDNQIDMQELNALMEQYTNIRPDKPIYVQYIDYMASLLQGDLGYSFWFQQPVSDILVKALPWTVFLLSLSIFITFTLGITVGAIMAYYEGTTRDYASTVVLMFLNSIPYYVFAIFAVYLLAYQAGWFPTGGQFSGDAEPAWTLAFTIEVLYHASLPVLSMVITGFGGTAITMRGNSVQVLGEDYIRVANLRGVPNLRIAIRYVGRNAILPMYTGLLISIGFMFGGAVIVEEIFAYQGIGYYLVRGIQTRDYPLMMGCFLIITLAVVIALFVADMTYSKIDPRIGTGGSRESH